MKNVNYQTIYDQLRNALGEPAQLHQQSPLDWCDSALEVLLATILTQATNDKNALKAWRQFKECYNPPERALEVPLAEVVEVIRPAGLAGQKAATIQNVLREVRAKLGESSLESLRKTPVAAWDFLTQLPGVGPKTAACVMAFGLGHAAFPVDTHIHRVAGRLGWVSKSLEPAKMQQSLTVAIPVPLHAGLHILLLNLGRQFCRPNQPKCPACPLRLDCAEAKSRLC